VLLPWAITRYPQSWCEALRGLWHGQTRDQVAERAFNELVSARQTRCCVCSMFESPGPVAKCSYEQEALTVVVNRSLIPDYHPSGDPLPLCSQCSIAVHQC